MRAAALITLALACATHAAQGASFGTTPTAESADVLGGNTLSLRLFAADGSVSGMLALGGPGLVLFGAWRRRHDQPHASRSDACEVSSAASQRSSPPIERAEAFRARRLGRRHTAA